MSIHGALRAPCRRRTWLVLLALALPASVLEAQSEAASQPSRPDYQALRFNETWTVLRSLPNTDPFDPVKFIALNDSGSASIGFGGQLRLRGEWASDFMLSDQPENTDSFGLLRALLHADVRANRFLRAFVEGKQAMVFSRDLPGGERPLDRDEWDVQNAFVDLLCCGSPALGVTLRVGRQELLMGSQRLLSPLDWANTRRTFDGGRLIARSTDLTADLFVTRPVPVRLVRPNAADSLTLFWGASVRPTVVNPAIGWEMYLLGLNQEVVTFAGRTGEHDRFTLGSRVTGMIGSTGTRFDLEGGYQFGSLADSDVRAWFVASDLTYSAASLPLRPGFTLGLDYSSGDADPGDGVAGTFHQLYPLGHAYAGYMDLLGRQNLVEARAVVSSTPIPPVTLRAALHHFLRAEKGDAVYNVGGGVFRPAAGDERSIGSEINVTAGYRLDAHTRMEVGFGHFRPGSFMTGNGSGASSSNWLYASTAFTF